MPKKFPCTAPGCLTLVIGGSLCERHKTDFSVAFRVCICGRGTITRAMADVCERCEIEATDWDDYDPNDYLD